MAAIKDHCALQALPISYGGEVMNWSDFGWFMAIFGGVMTISLILVVIFTTDWSRLTFRQRPVKWEVKEVDGQLVIQTEVTDHGALTEKQKQEIDAKVASVKKEKIWKIAREQEEQTQKAIKREWAIRDLRNIDATNPEFDDIVIEAVVDYVDPITKAMKSYANRRPH